MAGFSVTDAALTGFQVVQQRPKAVLIWALALIVVSLTSGAVLVAQFGGAMTQLMAISGVSQPDPAQALAVFRQVLPLYGAGLAFMLAFYSILFAALNRAVLRPQDDAFGYLRLGADELRQLALIVLMLILGAVFEFVLILVVGVVAGIIVAIVHAAAPLYTVVATGVAIAVVVAALAVVGVRFSLASAQTFATGRLNLFGSWAITKGRFWPMFGAYLLASALFVVVSLIGYVAIFAITYALPGGGLSGLFGRPNFSSLADYFSIARIVQLILGSALSAIALPVALTPAPAIYRALTEPGRSPIWSPAG